MGRRSSAIACVAAAVAVGIVLAAVPAASARDDSIRSFDGTKIVLHFFPAEGLKPGQRVPTVLFGPGWSQAGDDDENSGSESLFGSIGVGPLRRAGYNVLTWDPRGFGKSGGQASADGPDFEGRDVQALFDYVARQPEALLDAPGDARLGMTGASYGGGIQLVVAGIDNRVDALVPDIAWHSLVTSLYKDETVKGGWSEVLFAAGLEGGLVPGLVPGPGGIETGSLDPHIIDAYQEGTSTGRISPENVEWFRSRGPGGLVNLIRVPTLFTQGTVDTLFTLDEAITNYAILRRNGVPTKMLWFCGGHGACLTNAGDGSRIEKAALAWLARWLKRDTSVDTGPRFEGIDQNGKAFTADDYPLASGEPVVATGSGTLPIGSGGGRSGGLIFASRAAPPADALEVPITTPASSERLILGAPRLSLTYSGSAANPDTRVYAQIVDDSTGGVVGNMVTPLPVILDGKERTLERPLEVVSFRARPGSRLTLQLTPSTNVYDLQRTSGVVTFSKVRLELPTADTSKPPPGYEAAATERTRRGRLSLKVGRLSAKRGAGPVRAVVSTGGEVVRNVVITVQSARGRVVARSRPTTIVKRTRFVLRPRNMPPGAYMVSARGKHPDGRTAKIAKAVRKPRFRRR